MERRTIYSSRKAGGVKANRTERIHDREWKNKFWKRAKTKLIGIPRSGELHCLFED